MNQLLSLRLPLFVTGFFLTFISYRYLQSESYHLSFVIISQVLIILSICVSFWAMHVSKKENLEGEAKTWKHIVLWKLLVFISINALFHGPAVLLDPAPLQNPLDKIHYGGRLILLVIGIFYGVGVELSAARNAQDGKFVKRSATAWFLVGVLAIILVNVNFIASKLDKAYDWSYLKTATPSISTISTVQSLNEGVEIAVFISHDNEVTPFIRQYFDVLLTRAPQINLKYYDKDLQPSQAETYKVTRNGQVVLKKEKKRERLNIGTSISSARLTIKKLDSEFLKVFLRLTKERQNIYFTRGHGEMSWQGKKEFSSIKSFENLIKTQNFRSHFLPADGSIPEDANLLVIAGPREPFLSIEMKQIRSFVDRGGKLMVFLDPSVEVEIPGKDLLRTYLEDIGIEVKNHVLANEKVFMRFKRSKVDHWFIITNTFTSHESVSSLSKHDERVGVMAYQATYFDVTPEIAGWKHQPSVKSLNSTFADINKNFTLDKSEQRNSYVMGVASQRKVGDIETRMVVFSDAAIISDPLIRNKGNTIYALESLRWVLEDKSIQSEFKSEEDVKIRQSKKEDAIWFNATIVGVPMFILFIGFIATRRGRKS